MRHDYVLEGHAFRLRPLSTEDAAFVCELRSDPELTRFLPPVSGSVEDQISWTERYFLKPDDYCFVVERKLGEPEGMIGLYDIRNRPDDGRVAEWGRWILTPGSLAALESVWLIYRFGFENLALDLAYCRTVATNEPVLSFHRSFSLSTRKIFPASIRIRGETYDSIEQAITRSDWMEVEPKIALKAKRLASKLL